MKRLAILAATGFGLGNSPVASGTVGTLLGIPIAVGLMTLGPLWHVVGAIILVLLAFPLCDVAEKEFGTKDDGRIVADEYLTFPLCMIGLPLAPWVLCVGFLTHRVLDIIKPPPARGWQRFTGGFGIVIDDVVSSLYALVINLVLVHTVAPYVIKAL
jgi:phosphatidylglycerophosphatase A